MDVRGVVPFIGPVVRPDDLELAHGLVVERRLGVVEPEGLELAGLDRGLGLGSGESGLDLVDHVDLRLRIVVFSLKGVSGER